MRLASAGGVEIIVPSLGVRIGGYTLLMKETIINRRQYSEKIADITFVYVYYTVFIIKNSNNMISKVSVFLVVLKL